jgi:hypothetical protein
MGTAAVVHIAVLLTVIHVYTATHYWLLQNHALTEYGP